MTLLTRYELVLVARDHGSPQPFETLRFLSISLVDASESRPEFPDASNPYYFTVSENEERNVRVGKIQTSVKERSTHPLSLPSVYYYMLLGNENGAFYLDKVTGDLFTNKTLDREDIDVYHLYIQASTTSDLHFSPDELEVSMRSLERDSTVAKVQITVVDQNDNPPKFDQPIRYVGVNARSPLNQLIAVLNASDADLGRNAEFELMVASSNLYKFGSMKSVGSIVPSPFTISKDGRLSTASFMAEYNQDRFELEIIAKELVAPFREATAKVFVSFGSLQYSFCCRTNSSIILGMDFQSRSTGSRDIVETTDGGQPAARGNRERAEECNASSNHHR